MPDDTLLDVVDLGLVGPLHGRHVHGDARLRTRREGAPRRGHQAVPGRSCLSRRTQPGSTMVVPPTCDTLGGGSLGHELPRAPAACTQARKGAAVDWPAYRRLFIATLFRRGRAEIDLWPSQLDAAARALDVSDNMVVSLPDERGQDTLAELCILACLASERRVVFVTPLRALSAQTEVTLLRTFRLSERPFRASTARSA